jgi:hypothetical protein
MRRLFAVALLLATLPAYAQEKSVKPGINDPFKNPDVEKYKGTFEGESREVYAQREKLVAACGVKPGMVVADVGAGTGLHTRLFAKEVGDDGQVYAVSLPAAPRALRCGAPLTLRGAAVERLAPGQAFDLTRWRGEGRRTRVDVLRGAVRAVGGGPTY